MNVNSDDTVIAFNIISLWKQTFLLTVKSFTIGLIYCMEQEQIISVYEIKEHFF